MNRDMISRWKRHKHPTARPLTNRAIALGAVIVLGIGAATFTVLLWRYGGLDAIRTASAITVAAGGAAALLLAARRQQSTERTLEHERENAAEQRITELYTRAVDQLGAEKAPVRLGGLHALERLAQNNPTQRQTIVDVLCAYLRMPYTPPDDQAPGEDSPKDSHSRYEQRRQELQVRLTAQRILTAHLQPKEAAVFWENIGLDLTEAHLYQFDLTTCRVRRAQFNRTTFDDQAEFGGATFTEDADFDGATFTGDAEFTGAEFAGDARFGGVDFAGATFTEVTFAGRVDFGGATFTGTATFAGATFTGAKFVRTRDFGGVTFIAATFVRTADFGGAQFAGDVEFRRATFTETADFGGAQFAGDVEFRRATFTETADFGGTTFTGDTEFDGTRVALHSGRVVLPMGWTARPAVEGEEEGWLYVVRDEDSSEQSAEAPPDDEGGSGSSGEGREQEA